ncbi:flavoprotein [Nocardiopsis halophila]|uniref:flavoprotein n=1 Tax=Nocardiopsis halophila TaxID=141692 RepID=UPI0003471DB3|nr:flavoprotein [Nocardiopsis halophila]
MNKHAITGDLPGFGGKRVVVAGCGALAVAGLPGLVQQFQHAYPDADVEVVLTRQALQFATATTVNLVTGRPFTLDEWGEGPHEEAPHVRLAAWADAFVVYPATLHFVSRLANGLADTPLMLALQCTCAPIGVAPSLPPGGFEGHAYRRAAALLKERPQVVLADPVPGRSLSTGKANVGAPAPMAELLGLLAQVLTAADGERDR